MICFLVLDSEYDGIESVGLPALNYQNLILIFSVK